MRRNTSKRGLTLLTVGLLLLVVAGGWYGYNMVEDHRAGKAAADLLEKLEDRQAEQGENSTSPVILVDGDAFCGRLAIDSLGIVLPVYDQWDYARLKTSPCRYAGSVNTNDMIIAAHNYESHFGDLKRLQIGDEVVFMDAYGTSHRYAVKEITTLDGTAVTDMKAGEWDFTLFTCTKGGEQRVTVRCNRLVDDS